MSQHAAVVKDSLGQVRFSRQRAIDDPKQPLLRREVIGEPYQELDGLHMRDLRSLEIQRHRTHVALDGAADLVLLLGLWEAGDQDFDRPALHLARFDLRRRHDGMVAHAGGSASSTSQVVERFGNIGRPPVDAVYGLGTLSARQMVVDPHVP